jgi:hypothetical protein
MIGKTTTGKGFKGVLNYCLQEKKKAEILDYNGLSQNDPKGLAKEFEIITQENINISKPVWHTSLSFSEKDKMTNEKMTEIANKFLEKAGFSKENNQFIIIKHNDKAHTHCHIIANRVGFDGNAVSDYYNKSRTVGWAKELEKEYKLEIVQVLAKEKRLEKELNKPFDLIREDLKSIIDKALKQTGLNSIYDLQKELKKSGIDTTILKHSKSGKEYGITYNIRDKIYKGSELGKSYALNAINNRISPVKIIVKTLIKSLEMGI